jgi:hypothetical protein
MRKLTAFVIIFVFALASFSSAGRRSSVSSSSEHKKAIHVKGYTRKDGTAVKGYDRSAQGSVLRKDTGTQRAYSPVIPNQRDVKGHIKRSAAAKGAFMRSNPCPSTRKSSGKCPGYVVDHIKPLASGGLDDSSNMQWQTVQAAEEKDKWERK